MRVHLLDGTYELFRYYFAMPSARDADGREVAAVRGVVASVLSMVTGGPTHIGVATDPVIESFRNRVWCGAKTGRRSPLLARSRCSKKPSRARRRRLADDRVRADDALASAAVKAAEDDRVEQVIVCAPDRPRAGRNANSQLNRRSRVTYDEAGIVAKFACRQRQCRLPRARRRFSGQLSRLRLGAKSAAAVLAKFGHIEAIPDDRAVARQCVWPGDTREDAVGRTRSRVATARWRLFVASRSSTR